MSQSHCYAHTLPGFPETEWQDLLEHLEGVSRRAADSGEWFDAGGWAGLAGLWHDLGKYSDALQVKAPEHLKKFEERRHDQPEAAEAEAIVFSLLRESLDLNPKPAEDLSSGGPDFFCEPTKGSPCFVEVKAILTSTAERHSDLPTELSGAQAFSMLTAVISQAAQQKTKQLEGLEVAGVLAIVAQHGMADVLFSSLAAKKLLTGKTQISVPIGEREGEPIGEVTHLENSAFCRHSREGGIEPCRQTISAVLLVSIPGAHATVVGALHPKPLVELDFETFMPIPFAYLKPWPLKVGDRLEIHWRRPPRDEPEPERFLIIPPRLTEAELRGET